MKNLVIEKPSDSAIGPTFDPDLLTTDPVRFVDEVIHGIIYFKNKGPQYIVKRLFNPYHVEILIPEKYFLKIRGGKPKCAAEWTIKIEDALRERRKTDLYFSFATIKPYVFDYNGFTLQVKWYDVGGLSSFTDKRVSEACYRADVPRKIIYVDEDKNDKKASAKIRGDGDSHIIFETHIEDVSEGDVIPIDLASYLPKVLSYLAKRNLKEREIDERFSSAFSRIYGEGIRPHFDFFSWRELAYRIPEEGREELRELDRLEKRIDGYIDHSIEFFKCEDEVRKFNLEKIVEALKSRNHLAFKQIHTYITECISEGRGVPKVSKIIEEEVKKIYQQDYGDGKTYRKSSPEEKLETVKKVVSMVKDIASVYFSLDCRYHDPKELLERSLEAYNI